MVVKRWWLVLGVLAVLAHSASAAEQKIIDGEFWLCEPAPTPTPTPTPLPTATPTAVPVPTEQPEEGNGAFACSGTIEEAGDMEDSADGLWWVNSGGRLLCGSPAKTIQGELRQSDYWRMTYARTNPRDTDQGYHPQNIFRLVARAKWRNVDQLVRFRVNRLHLSASSNRNASNGVLLFNRYLDGDNLYYVGVRVDGYAVIKKKLRGTYWTLGSRRIWPGAYSRSSNPNLMPLGQWIELRSRVVTNDDGSVTVRAYVDGRMVLEAVDTGSSAFGGAPIRDAGHAGIRTDFLDAEFAHWEAKAAR